MGGTFNPIHLGHLILAQSALEALELNKVLFIPSANPPHKAHSAIVPASDRLAMVEAAIEGDLCFEASDIEIRRKGPSYTFDTVRELRAEYRDASLYFIIGADTLTELHLWKNVYELLDLCTFVTFGRPDARARSIQPEDLQLEPPWPERLLKNYTTLRLVDISSSDVRHRVAEGMSIRYLVPPAVEIYIAEHRLYGK